MRQQPRQGDLRSADEIGGLAGLRLGQAVGFPAQSDGLHEKADGPHGLERGTACYNEQITTINTKCYEKIAFRVLRAYVLGGCVCTDRDKDCRCMVG